jgi:flagellar biogenesis protein FliO
MTMLQQYIRILLSLLFIGSILMGIYFILARFPLNKISNKKNKRIFIQEQVFLAQSIVLLIIKVDNNEFLVGVSNKSINFIQPINSNLQNFKDIYENKKAEKDIE